jgi:hypothetical protein
VETVDWSDDDDDVLSWCTDSSWIIDIGDWNLRMRISKASSLNRPNSKNQQKIFLRNVWLTLQLVYYDYVLVLIQFVHFVVLKL